MERAAAWAQRDCMKKEVTCIGVVTKHGLLQGIRMERAAAWVQREWPAFEAGLRRAGWRLDRVALGAGPWRAAWGDALPSSTA